MGYAKFNKKDNSSMITLVGEIINSFQNKNLFDKSTFSLDELMREQGSAMRMSYNDITKRDLSRKESTAITSSYFINNQRYMRDAYALAEQCVQSQTELLPTYLEDTIKDRTDVEKKLQKLKKSKRAKHKTSRVARLKRLIKKLSKKITFYEQHIENGTVPPAVFGKKQNMRNIAKNKITNAEWKDLRSNSLYAIGEKSKNGNENIRLKYIKNNIFNISILNPLSDKRGDRINLSVKFPQKMADSLASYLSTGEAYTVLIKRSEGKYKVNVTLSAHIPLDDTLFDFGVCGIDMNPDNISATIVSKTGQYLDSKIFKFPEINYVSSNKRNYIIGNTVKAVIEYAKSYGVQIIVIEDLKFKNNFGNNSNLNRLLSGFVHSKITNTFGSRCYKENMVLKKVNPSYTSFIGRVKYQKPLALSVHEAAAMCIARKGLGLKEKLPRKMLKDFFTMEVEKTLKFDEKINKQNWRDMFELFTNIKFRNSINKLDSFHLEKMGFKRYPREWFFEDYLRYAQFYLNKLISELTQMYFKLS